MLWNASAIKGYAIAASDGRLGTVSDFLFDDAGWSIRWLVVDTGNWLSGRKVLLPPSALGHPDPKQREFSVGLAMQQVRDSPDIDTDRPVSRQMEANVYDYYGWSPYWGMGLYMGGYGYAGSSLAASSYLESRRREEAMADTQRDAGDPHLRSIEAVTGYHVHASDGEIGHIKDFLLEDTDWSIHFLVVDTRNWWPGKQVLISPRSAQEINWRDRLVNLNVDRQKVKDSPVYDASTTVDGAYEKRFHDHYGEVDATGQL
ncbi:MAG: PRC-barrel domain-containing protein [Acetobacteraceae bacterium]|jgi:hypothetical protein